MQQIHHYQGIFLKCEFFTKTIINKNILEIFLDSSKGFKIIEIYDKTYTNTIKINTIFNNFYLIFTN